MGILSKLAIMVIQTFKIHLCNQNLYNQSAFVVVRYQIYNYLIIYLMSLAPLNFQNFIFCKIINLEKSIYMNHHVKRYIMCTCYDK